MFTRRGHGDVKKSIQKVLDPKKDVLTRLKHLRSMLENAASTDIIDRGELKTFFESNCSQIYFIFYENFTTLESSLKQKGGSPKKLIYNFFYCSFQKILQNLPEKIYNRWQFHSIGSILKKLLHTGNSFKIRCEGIRLFLLWLQALRDNCAEEQFLIFACLVPGFPAVPSSRGPCTLDTIIYNPFSASPDDRVVPEEITPLVPAVAGDKAADDQTCYILETLLKYMVIQASSLEWKNKENQDTGFRFLFSLFKKYYLPHLFPSFPKLTNLYKPVLDLPHHRPKPLYVPVTRNNESTFCTRDQYLAPRVAFISWLVTFFLEKKYVNSAAAAQSAKNGAEVIPKLIQTVTAPSSSQEKEKDKLSDGDVAGPAGEPEKSHSNSSTLSDRRPSDSSLCSIEEEHRYVYEMVHAILLSTRENVNFVNEVFHQAFLLPSCEASATRKVIKVYRKWILQEKPNFMAEPDKNIHSHEVDSCEQTRSTEISIHMQSHGHRRTSSWGRTYSFSSAISRGFFTEERNTDVKTGIQPALQVFLTNSSNVFLLEPCQDVPKLLDNQVEVCKGVLSIYRHMIMEHTMDTQTWLVEQLLQVLLRVTEAVMKRPQENQKKDSFAQSLASILFRTIIVAWVRANLSVFISRELWDELLAVLSSLTYWEELVMEWANIMDSLTAVLARSVYGLDMANLPLDKLSEQKEKKQRGRGVLQDSQKAAAVARSFSLSWRNQGEPGGPGVQEPMRIRSATTSGAPGVEKARNNVRQKASAKRSQSISNCAHLYEALPTTKSVPMLLHTVSSFLPGISSGNSACSHRLSGKVHSESCTCLCICLLLLLHLFHSLNLILFSLLFLNARFSWACPARSRFELFVWWPATLNPALFDHADSSECLADDVSIIAGGTLTGWHADSAFVLWRRILGILGDVNNIRCPKIHAKVFSYLYELWHKLAKIRDNLGISVDNQSSPPRPVFIPPIRMLASWLFKATMLSDEYKAGKLQAYKLICEMMTRHQDVLPNSDFLVHLYHIMHNGINNNDQDVLNTIIRSCSSRFFFLGLPGFTLLVGDFITSSAPRVEAQTILGSLVCFPNVYHQIPLLQHVPASDDVIVCNEDIKDYLVNILLDTATKEHCEEARCIAVCSLGLWVCEELMQKNIHQQVTDAINVLGVTLKVSNPLRKGPFVRSEMQLRLGCLLSILGNVIMLSVSSHQLMVSLLLCLLDWCMAVPLSLLLEPITMSFLEDRTSHKVHYKRSLPARLHFNPMSNFIIDERYTFSEIISSHSLVFIIRPEKRRRNMELIPLTARMVMTHLVNHLGHHPLRGGPALLHSLLSENHDNPYVESSELSSEVFKSPNLQLFVFNDSTLVSYLQIPSESHTVGRPPQPSYQVRVIVRDISGKYSWDGAILYCTSQDDPTDVGVFNEPDPPLSTSSSVTNSRNSPTSGSYKMRRSDSASDCCEKAEVDVLDKLLECLGQCSPECLPHAQLRLNQPAPSPNGMNLEQESSILEAILRQTQQEEKQVRTWDTDVSFRATCQGKPSQQEPKAPFYFCRLLLNDLGMNSWDRRKSFHLLKKNSKLLRELKNLDSRQCRETHKFAVFYIGEGQEDKCSILSNSSGSQAFEDFVSGLGWEVDLATHCGFMGGLQRNGSTGLTAPYYATSTVEAIFHVSTRMPSDSDDCLTKKLRHLGNDEVHIVWSEHTRDYRPGIIPTDFGDVLIIIYPMKNHMYFIQIVKKPQVPFFGPLFNGAIITGTLLPSLVRATCINASRAVKSRLTLYQSFYEERALYLDAIVQNHREVVTFEDFASQVFSPSPGYPMSGTGEKSSPPPPPPVTSLLQVASILAVRSEPSHLSSCHPFFTSSTSATPIYLCLTPGCRRWPMNIKRGRSDRLQTRCRLLLNPPSCCCVGLFLFANCYFDCNYFPYEYKEAF
uniref:Ral GTPase activating protein catalytic subunit alpha 2 n=1 Tax=Takifugu rubripes TaxID=31033 RepID=A0A674PC42_TAKRU